MEVESKKKSMVSPSSSENKGRRRKRSKMICAAVTAVILIIGILMLVLGLTVFKAKRPVTTVNSVSLRDFDLSIDILGPRVRLNVSVDANVAVKNPNKVGFRFTNSSALLKYRGQVVGEVPIPAGKIGAQQTLPMNITLTLMADRLLSSSNLYSDVVSGGTLPLSTSTRISGHVRILFKIHVVSYATCDFYVNVINRRITNQTCHYKTKF